MASEPSADQLRKWDLELNQTFSDIESDDLRVLSTADCRREIDQAFSDQVKDTGSNPDKVVTDHMEKNKEHSSGFLGRYLKWSPSGLPKTPIGPSCDNKYLEEAIEETAGYPIAQEARLREHFDRCGEDLQRDWPGNLWGLAKIGTVKYNMCDHPRVRKIHFKVDDQYIQRAYLALKPDPKPRPLVIIKCGAFCNTGDSTAKWSMMHTFDSGPFNALLVGNFTGLQFTTDNRRIAIGGHEEGMTFVRIAKWLRNHRQLSKRISSIHIVGISLGGHAALYGGYYSGYNRTSFNRPPIQSAIAICPAVDLQPSLKNLFQTNIKGKIMRRLFLSEVTKAISIVPILGDIFRKATEPDEIADNPEIPHRIAQGTIKYYNETNYRWQLDPFENLQVTQPEELWKLNKFQRFARVTSDIPVLALNSKNDWVVNFNINGRVLSNTLDQFRGLSKLQVINFDNGNHCALSQAYGWDTMTTLMKTYLLSNSPQISADQEVRRTSFQASNWGLFRNLYKNEEHISQYWKIDSGDDHFVVRFKVFTPYKSFGCWNEDNKYNSKRMCYRKFAAKVPVANLPVQLRRVPKSESEAEEMSRWANHNIKFENSEGHNLEGTEGFPTTIRWKSYENY